MPSVWLALSTLSAAAAALVNESPIAFTATAIPAIVIAVLIALNAPESLSLAPSPFSTDASMLLSNSLESSPSVAKSSNSFTDWPPYIKASMTSPRISSGVRMSFGLSLNVSV